jgi:hypothetical protein
MHRRFRFLPYLPSQDDAVEQEKLQASAKVIRQAIDGLGM